MIKVSIIVPVYNSEKYLKRCLDSILNQSLSEIELIVVNDMSTDNSINILNEYKKQYKDKIIVIDMKQKGGPGGARNEGILAAKGEYIGFVDSDDNVEINMYEVLYSIAKKSDYDMVDCGFFNEYANENMRTIGNNSLGNLTLSKKQTLMMHAGFIWSKIIKRNILIENNIKFRENVIYEDIDFIRKVILYLSKIAATEEVLYYYRNNSKSITNSADNLIQISEKINAIKSIVSTYKNLNVYEDYKNEITYVTYKTYLNLLDLSMTMGGIVVKENIFYKLRSFFFDICDESYTKNKYIKDIPMDQRIFAEVNNREPDKLVKYVSI